MSRQYFGWIYFLEKEGTERTLSELAKDRLDAIATKHLRDMPEPDRTKLLKGYLAGRFI